MRQKWGRGAAAHQELRALSASRRPSPLENTTPTFPRPAHLARTTPPRATTAAQFRELVFTRSSALWPRARRLPGEFRASSLRCPLLPGRPANNQLTPSLAPHVSPAATRSTQPPQHAAVSWFSHAPVRCVPARAVSSENFAHLRCCRAPHSNFLSPRTSRPQHNVAHTSGGFCPHPSPKRRIGAHPPTSPRRNHHAINPVRFPLKLAGGEHSRQCRGPVFCPRLCRNRVAR